MAGSSDAFSKNFDSVSLRPLSVQLVPMTYSFSRPRYFSTDLSACTAHPTPMNSTLFSPRASTSASTERFGDRAGLTPLEDRISSTVVASMGLGCIALSGSDATHTTPSTLPDFSISIAMDVTMPVHCAPSTGRLRLA